MSEGGHRASDRSASAADDCPSAEAGDAAEPIAHEVIDPAGSRRWKRGDTARVVIAGLALLACWASASSGVPEIERTVFSTVNNAPGWLYPVVWPIMQLGNVAVAVALVLLVGIVVGKPRLGVLLALSAVLAWIVAKVVKAQVARGRPGPEGLDVVLRGPMEDGFGFISGHTTVAFAVAAVAAPHLRRPWNWVALGIVTAVGLARIYVGVHLPLDVVGGAACGLLIGEVVRVVEVRTRSWRPTRSSAEVR